MSDDDHIIHFFPVVSPKLRRTTAVPAPLPLPSVPAESTTRKQMTETTSHIHKKKEDDGVTAPAGASVSTVSLVRPPVEPHWSHPLRSTQSSSESTHRSRSSASSSSLSRSSSRHSKTSQSSSNNNSEKDLEERIRAAAVRSVMNGILRKNAQNVLTVPSSPRSL